MSIREFRFGHLAFEIAKNKYLGNRDWRQLTEDVIESVVNFNDVTRKIWTNEEIEILRNAILYRWFLPGGRYLYYSNKDKNFYNNCMLFGLEDTREGWAGLAHDAMLALMSGAGIGIDYSKLRHQGAKIIQTGGEASGPIALMEIINEIGKKVMQGGSRRSAIYSSLHWKHPDIMKFIKMKNWSEAQKRAKEKDFFADAPLDNTNISVRLDKDFWRALRDEDPHANMVFIETIKNMLQTSEPGFQNDWDDQIYRNACSEIISADSHDICNLGSVNLGKLDTIDELRDVVKVGTKFLMCGSIASHSPIEKIEEIKIKNRRIGLGLMGLHEWLLKRSYRYRYNEELDEWMKIYRDVSEGTADRMYKTLEINRPKGLRAIAPTGTIAIVGETTSGIEPIFAVAYKRTYVTGFNQRQYQYVIDNTAKRLIQNEKIDPNDIEDAMDLANEPVRRIEMQYELQKYVDHAISSTINLPNWQELGAEEQSGLITKFSKLFKEYLPGLRGITVYSDGSRGGQPLEKVDYEFALEQEGRVFNETSTQSCRSSVCGA